MKLIRKKNIPFWNYYKDGVTQSLINSFLQCPIQTKLNYYDGWSPKQYSEALHFGNTMHYVFSEVYGELSVLPSKIICSIKKYEDLWEAEQGKPDIKQLEKNEQIYTLALATLQPYFRYYKKDFDWNWLYTEKNFKVVYDNTFLRGKIDGVLIKDDQHWLIDHKCLSRINENVIASMLPFDTQVMLYALSYWKMTNICPRGIIYNIIRRSGIKQKQGQSLDDWGKEVEQKIWDNPEYFFIRIPLQFEEKELMNWEKNWLIPNLRRIENWYKSKCTNLPMNPNALETKYGKSFYFDMICDNDKSGYFKRKHVFAELESII